MLAAEVSQVPTVAPAPAALEVRAVALVPAYEGASIASSALIFEREFTRCLAVPLHLPRPLWNRRFGYLMD